MKTNKKIRSNKGTLLIEMCSALPIMVAMIALTLDASFGIMACLTLDGACVDAARAAALAPDKMIAQQRAQVALESHKNSTLKPEVVVTEFEDYGGDVTKGPYLVVNASVDYKLPFPVSFMGFEGMKDIKFTRMYAYPILTIKPSLPG